VTDDTKFAIGFTAALVAPGTAVLLIAKAAGASWLLASTLGAGTVAAVAATFTPSRKPTPST